MVNKIVYVYNYQEIVMVTRDSDGDWHYTYSIGRVMEYLNKKNGTRYTTRNGNHLFDVGKILGYLIYPLINRCRRSYGDPEETIKSLTYS